MDLNKKDAEEGLLEDGLQKIVIVRQESKQKQNLPVISVVDVLLSVLIVTPLVVFTWRGIWGFMDIHGDKFPLSVSFILGITIHIVLAVSQDHLHSAIVQSDKHWSLKIVSHFLRRFYTYVFLTITVLHWRGCWGLLDLLFDIRFTAEGVAKKEGSLWMILLCGLCFTTLISIKGLRNATAPPFAICIDKGNYVFRFPTMFRKKTKHSLGLTILDAMFSVAVMGNLVVSFWRGLWVITDILLLPDNFLWSSWMSLILGIIIVGLVYRLQNFFKTLCAKLTGVPKIIAADTYIVMSILATILYWRGIWSLSIIYIIPIIIGCSNTLLVRGVYKDAKEPNGECVVFPCKFLEITLAQENIIEAEESNDTSKA
ncbi:uncharacterized protein LOC126737102 isoform X2 [Anthonomus grandis grandis]|uniref:uncharacterized protein LOC126737102 isoform X2 n=1 Tax=Anthonomus grandis grandis TaxID=2921223 RepID=UPI0021667922|nr:uncharacterized protein LOC126737102 isoform X2 [Anthonomus grandis grandis]